MGLADTERRKRDLDRRERCFQNMLNAGRADGETRECETVVGESFVDNSDCYKCRYASAAALAAEADE